MSWQVLEALERADQGPVGAGHLADERVLDGRVEARRGAWPRGRRRLAAARQNGRQKRALHLLGQPARGPAAVDVDFAPLVQDGALDLVGQPVRAPASGRASASSAAPRRPRRRAKSIRRPGLRVRADPLAERPGLGMALFGQQGVELELRSC